MTAPRLNWHAGLTLPLILLCGQVMGQPAQPPPTKIQWEHLLLGPGGGWSMVQVNPRNDNIVYVSSDMGNWAMSEDGGDTWTEMTPAQLQATGAGGLMDHQLLTDPKDPNVLFICSGGVAKSTDRGKTWTLLLDVRQRGGTFNYGSRLTMDPTDPQVMYYGGCAGDLFRSDDGGAHWTELKSAAWGQTRRGGADLMNLVVTPDHAVTACMYGKGFFQSSDKGATWTGRNAGLPHLLLRSFLASTDVKAGRTVFYALLEGKPEANRGELYRSTDEGATWERVQVVDAKRYEGRRLPIWCQLAVSPANPDVVYLTAKDVLEEWGNHGTYRTLDGGKTWTFLAGEYDRNWLEWGPIPFTYSGFGYDCFAVSAQDPMKLYRADQSMMFRSDDGGQSWHCLSQHPTEQGYYRSTGLEDICVLGVAVDPTDPRRVYLGAADNGFMKSRDGGRTWRGGFFKGLGVRNARTEGVIVDPADPATLYLGHAGELNGFFAVSHDYGETWQRSTVHPEWGLPQQANLLSLLLDADSKPESRVLYASLIGQGVIKSEDGGVSWRPCHTGLPEVTAAVSGPRDLGRQVIQLLKPSNGPRLYALVAENAGLWYSTVPPEAVKATSLYVSDNRGESWQKVEAAGEAPPIIARLAVDPLHPDVLYAAATAAGAWQSSDGGKTWRQMLHLNDATPVNDIAIDQVNPQRLYVALTGSIYQGAYDYGIWMSEDAGKTWHAEDAGFGHAHAYRLYPDPTREGVIRVATRGNAAYVGYVSGVARPEPAAQPARSPLEQRTEAPVPTREQIAAAIKSAALTAATTPSPVTLDGRLTEPQWQQARPVTGFTDLRTGLPAEKQTTVRALRDADWLYLGIVCDEPHPLSLVAKQRPRDGSLWDDDAVEVLLARGTRGGIYQFIVNAAGARFDAAYDALRCDASWQPQPDWRAAVQVGKATWTAELALPLAAIGGDPGAPLRLKVCRDDQVDLATSSWPPSPGDSFVVPPAQFAALLSDRDAAGTNLLPNGDCEHASAEDPLRPASWTTPRDDWQRNSFWTNEVAHSGQRSLKLTAPDTSREYSWSSPMIPVAGDQKYQLSLWAKHAETTAYGLIVAVYFLDAAGQCPVPGDEPRGDWYTAMDYGGPFDWQRFSRLLHAPPGATQAQVVLRLYKTAGTIYYDDISFEAVG